MIRSAAFLLALILLLPAAARAEVFALGDKTFAYDVPDGFVQLDPARHRQYFNLFESILPPGVNLVAIIFTVADEAALSRGEPFTLDEYIIIGTEKTTSAITWNREMLDLYKGQFTSGAVDLTQLAHTLMKERIHEATGLDLEMMFSKPVIIDEDDDFFSMGIKPEGGTDSADFELYIIINSLLMNGKLIQVHQFKSVDSEADIVDFIAVHKDVLNAMNIRPQ